MDEGYAVLICKGGAFKGRIGMTLYKHTRTGWQIQFGASGPVARIEETSFRYATVDEVKNAGMYGTGFKIKDFDE